MPDQHDPDTDKPPDRSAQDDAEEALRLSDRLTEELLSEDSNVIGGLLRKELLQRVTATLAQLGRIDRELLILRHLEGLSGAECGLILGISEEAVKKRYVEAVGRLRRLLDDKRP